jgi:hypothetical protein
MNQYRHAVLLFSVYVILALSTKAQKIGAKSNATHTTILTAIQWKAVEGYYRSTTNKNLYVQSIAHDSVLLMKLLWQKDIDTLRPHSDLVFGTNKQGGEGSDRATFVKDSGEIATSVVYSGYKWDRVKDYKPVAIQVMPHTPDQLIRFAGIYHSQGDSNNLLQFAVEGNDLVIKERETVHIVPQSELSFYRPDNLWFSVDFSQDQSGNITQALIVKRDVWVRNPKPATTTARLHSFEGKYRAKNDSDNVIQLMARGHDLLIKQLWDGKTVILTPLADLFFYNKAQSYSLQFVRDADGKVRQAWLFDTTEFDKEVEK